MNDGQTFLIIASRFGDCQIDKWLLEQEPLVASINETNCSGDSVLDYAVAKGF